MDGACLVCMHVCMYVRMYVYVNNLSLRRLSSVLSTLGSFRVDGACLMCMYVCMYGMYGYSACMYICMYVCIYTDLE